MWEGKRINKGMAILRSECV